MNPYKPSPASPSPSGLAPPRRPIGLDLIAVAGLLFVAVTVSLPGIVLLVSEKLRPMPPGRRYATYDRELFFFGFEISATTAAWMALALAPCLILSGLILLLRRRSRLSSSVAAGSITPSASEA